MRGDGGRERWGGPRPRRTSSYVPDGPVVSRGGVVDTTEVGETEEVHPERYRGLNRGRRVVEDGLSSTEKGSCRVF